MRSACLFALLAVAACGQRPDTGPVVVSAIGESPRLADAAAGPLTAPARLLVDATAQGLVRFDAAGQVEPGLAERWIVVDDGLGYIFRLRDARWSDGRPMRAGEVVAILRRELAPASNNPLRPFLTAIDEIVEMTPEVIEIRLTRPRPDLLKLFAQPELAILRTRPLGGGGPMRADTSAGDAIILRPDGDLAVIGEDAPAPPTPEQNVRLIGERAASAIVRFRHRASDLVSGGTFRDWPLLANAEIAEANRRIDPAAGLFGFAITRREGFLADPANRAAVAQSIDRATIVAAFGGEWQSSATLLPDRLDSARPPASPASESSGGDPAPSPAARVTAWQQVHSEPVTLDIAMPDGPGATIVYGITAANLRRIGIIARRVGERAPADLTLVDAVAPYDSARWYLVTACRPCGPDAAAAIEAARLAPTLAERGARIAEADAAMAADIAFITIARPFRWSLVAVRLRQWQPNARAWHPLNRLRQVPN